MDYHFIDLIYPVADADSFADTRTNLFQCPKLVTSEYLWVGWEDDAGPKFLATQAWGPYFGSLAVIGKHHAW